MTNLSPLTAMEEGVEERSERERQTGVLGNGHTVQCHPTGEPDIFERQSRVVCLAKPYVACGGCRHSKFKLIFNADPSVRLQTVKCPRWDNDTARMRGELPSSYAQAEVLTCSSKPFAYCPSCPSLEDLSKMFIDKTKEGWYARYRRFIKEEGND